MSTTQGIRNCLLKFNNFKYVIPMYYNHKYKGRSNGNCRTIYIASVLCGAAGIGIKEYDKQIGILKTEKPIDVVKAEESFLAGEKRADLPTFRADEVMKHNTLDSFWVTYKYGVYDITKFLPQHPGGEQIYNAAGLSIEPFWNVYGMHKTEEIFKTLESYRIGNLHEDDIMIDSGDELWAKEPGRDLRLLIKTKRPFNAEIPMKLQVENLDTPNNLFYVRQHMPVPELDEKTHKLTITIKSKTTVTKQFNLKDLKRMPQVDVRAALMCAGNRRSEMNETKPVKGLAWKAGAISNALWTGVYLRDILIQLGVDPKDTEGKHVVFTGSDIDATGENFSTSIPLTMAMDSNAKILLALKMNGEILPLDHGYPLRVVVPGSAAVRSVKWLEAITISELESTSHWHLKDYRSFNSSKTWENADFSKAPPIYTLPVTSAICLPNDGETVTAQNGHIEVKGYAYSGGGAKIVRVDISPDKGDTWVEADLIAYDSAPPRQHYSWTLWKSNIPVSNNQMELWVKATDSNFNTQPENFNHIWNIRGLLSNAYHKIKINIKE